MKNLIRKILKENSFKNKEKMISLLEKLLNDEVKKIQLECEDFEQDNISKNTCRDIHNIDKIKITNIEEYNDILMIYVNVDIDSIFQYMDVVEVLYDVKQRVSKTYGQRITLIEVEVNNINTKREW